MKIAVKPIEKHVFFAGNVVVFFFKEKFLRESGFPHFSCFWSEILCCEILFFWPPFCNCISDFRLFCCILVLLDYFISAPHFTAKFIRESIFLS